LTDVLSELQANEEENRALAEDLRELNANLEDQVRARTHELESKNKELEVLAKTDRLTGALNRAAFTNELTHELFRAHRYNRPASLLMMDIDFFKQINDTYGHHAGDEALKAFAAHCTRYLREVDLFGRLGGEEFAAFLPETTSEAAATAANRLRGAPETETIPVDGQELSLRVSIGISAVKDSDNIESLMQRADASLYAAKQRGRNQVVEAS
jgi:diguanylate cyclase (GGDEF)-like protein